MKKTIYGEKEKKSIEKKGRVSEREKKLKNKPSNGVGKTELKQKKRPFGLKSVWERNIWREHKVNRYRPVHMDLL